MEGRTTLKLSVSSIFSATFFLFIAAPPSRGADRGITSNSTPTMMIIVMLNINLTIGIRAYLFDF